MVTMFALAGPKVGYSTTLEAEATDSGSVSAPSPRVEGIYLDHRGDGAIEFKPCADKLCGHVVWVRAGATPEACGRQIIGDAARVRDGVWDGGWIFDPDSGQEFDVEITHLSDGDLQVMGYLGSKDLSETFVWKRAPAGLELCSGATDVAAK